MGYAIDISVTSEDNINLAEIGEIYNVLVRPAFAWNFQLGVNELFMGQFQQIQSREGPLESLPSHGQHTRAAISVVIG